MNAPKTDPLPPLRDVINKHGLDARKSLGQNFLLDLNLTRRIARVAEPLADCSIFEVGPGPGGLTRGLLMEGAGELIVVERDQRCIPALQEISEAFPGRVTIIEDDALALGLDAIAEKAKFPSLKIASNLPYNIGTQLFVNWVTGAEWPPKFTSLSLMFQREVADRIVARPGSKAYGRLSILAGWRGKAKIAVKVPPSAFTPPPKIDSAVIHYHPTEPLDASVDIKDLEKLTEAAFGQRRKMLRSSLKALHPEIGDVILAAGLKPEQRAETVDVPAFVSLAKALNEFKSE